MSRDEDKTKCQLVIYHDGDASVGIPPEGAYLDLSGTGLIRLLQDRTELRHLCEDLKKFFQEYFDFPIQVYLLEDDVPRGAIPDAPPEEPECDLCRHMEQAEPVVSEGKHAFVTIWPSYVEFRTGGRPSDRHWGSEPCLNDRQRAIARVVERLLEVGVESFEVRTEGADD